MIENSGKSWTFLIPGTDCIAVFFRDWEGLFVLNSTASWIWQHLGDPNLSESYAACFGISQAKAQEDIALTLDGWSQWKAPSNPLPDVLRTRPENPSVLRQYQLNGTFFSIAFATDEIAAELVPRLAQIELNSPRAVDHAFHLSRHPEGTAIYRDGVHIATEPLITGARAVLLQELTQLAVPDRRFTLILHAGAVGNQDAAVILAGASFSGKSTLCTALMQSGLLCYSDDSACLTTDYRVAGLPFALALREGSWPLFPHLDRPRFIPSNLNGTSPTAPPVALIFVDYNRHAQVTTLESVRIFDALVALQQSGFWVEPSQSAITTFLDWLSRLPIYRLRYSNLNEAVSQVSGLLAAQADVC